MTRGGVRSLKSYIAKIIGGWIRLRLIQLGKIPCHTYRDFILKNIYLMDIEENAIIYGGFEIRAPWKIHIGKGSIIGDNSILDGRNGIFIGENVNFSTGVNIWTEQHDLNSSDFGCKGGAVTIEDYAWCSTRTIILPGVNIHKGAVIAAGAVVTKDCEKFTVYGGIPAKKIGVRNNDLQYKFNGNYIPFY